jgi:hypothetical protein
MRLDFTARQARAGDYESFTTTLLYSKYQKHELIKDTGEKLAKKYQIRFLYRDFREGWSEGVQAFLKPWECIDNSIAVVYSAKMSVMHHDDIFLFMIINLSCVFSQRDELHFCGVFNT